MKYVFAALVAVGLIGGASMAADRSFNSPDVESTPTQVNQHFARPGTKMITGEGEQEDWCDCTMSYPPAHCGCK